MGDITLLMLILAKSAPNLANSLMVYEFGGSIFQILDVLVYYVICCQT